MNIKNKRVLITGADGFIGSHLTELLLKKGARVRAFCFYNSFNSWGWLDTLSRKTLGRVEIFMGDVRDPNGVRESIKGIDAVFHLAALVGIPFSYHSPDSYVDTNLKGTLNVLQAAKSEGVKRVLVTSTSEVYGTAQYAPIDEKHPFQGQSPYSASKIAADRMAEAFYRSFKTPVVIARPFNTFGPRQSARAIIPTIITQLLQGKKEICLGSLHPTRDFNYVTNTCEGITALMECDQAAGREVNIGSGEEISVGDLAKLIISLTGTQARISCEKLRRRPKESEVERLCCDNSLIRELTGWQPRVSLQEGLVKTIAWFKDKSNLKKYKAHIYNV